MNNQILEELKSREPIFHHPELLGKTKQDILNQMCDEFFESEDLNTLNQIPPLEDHIELLWIPLDQLPELDLRAEPLKQLVPNWLKTASVDVFKSEMTPIPPL